MKKFSILLSVAVVVMIIIASSVSAFSPFEGTEKSGIDIREDNHNILSDSSKPETVAEKKKFFEDKPSPSPTETTSPNKAKSSPSPTPEKPKASPKPSSSPSAKKPQPKPLKPAPKTPKPVTGKSDKPEKPKPTPLKKSSPVPAKIKPIDAKKSPKPGKTPGAPPSTGKDVKKPKVVEKPKHNPRPPIPKTGPIPMLKGESYTYVIKWQDKMVGYSKFYVANVLSLAGEKFYKLESVSKLKIGMGQIEKLSFASNMTVRASDYAPTFFHGTQKQGAVQFDVDCLISSNLLAQTNKSGTTNNGNIYSFENEIPKIFFNNLWGRIDTLVEHYWMLLRTRQAGKIHAYDPILQAGGKVEIVKEGDTSETIEIDGKKVKAHHFRIIGFRGEVLFNIWTDQWRNILKMEEPGGGLTFELTNSDVISKFDEIKGVDMWKDRVSRSNIFFPNAREIKFMKTEVEVQGRGVTSNFPNLKGLKQEFSGEEEPGNLKGTFTTETAEVELEKPYPFPIKGELPAEIQPYTRKEIGIEIKDKKIRGKALETAWKSPNVWEAAKKVNRWVKDNIVLGISLPSAKMTLSNEQGNSESKALLAIALCRSIGIPARRAGGFIFSAGNFIPHYWFEVWTGPESGWVPLDPSTGDAGVLGASHVKLFGNGEIWKLKVKVLDFNPKPKERITYINREITWPVGEERIYAVKHKDKKIGEETALMEEVTLLDEQETYKMNLNTHLEMGNRTMDADAVYWMTPQGLPFRYMKKVKSGDMEEDVAFRLDGKMMIQTVKDFSGNYERQIPFSKGAYFSDPHFLCQWALIAGQFYDIKVGKTYKLHVFIPQSLSLESITATVKNFESVEAGEKIYDCFRIDTNKGIVFWIQKDNYRVVKVSFKVQQIDLELVKSRLKI